MYSGKSGMLILNIGITIAIAGIANAILGIDSKQYI